MLYEEVENSFLPTIDNPETFAPTAETTPLVVVGTDVSDMQEIPVKSLYADVGTSVQQRFAAVYKSDCTLLNCPKYIIWRSSQYVYNMLVLTDSNYNGTTAVGRSLLYTFDMTTDYTYTFKKSTVNNYNPGLPVSGSLNSYYVYSNIDGYAPSAYVEPPSFVSVYLLSFLSVVCFAYVFKFIKKMLGW